MENSTTSTTPTTTTASSSTSPPPARPHQQNRPKEKQRARQSHRQHDNEEEEEDGEHSSAASSATTQPSAAVPSASYHTSSSPISSTASSASYLLFAKITSAKSISSILSCIHFKKDQWATCILSHDNVRFVVEEDKCLQATVSLKRNMFQQYQFPDSVNAANLHATSGSNASGISTAGSLVVQFQINLSILIDCLNMYGSATEATSLHMQYPGVESTLVLELTEGDVVTDCKIRTRPADDTLDMQFRDSPIMSKVILKSAALKEAISETEWFGETLVFRCIGSGEESDEEGSGLQIKCTGDVGSNQIDLPRDSDAYYDFDCDETHANPYRLSHIERCIKALGQSERTCIRMNAEGTLCLQHMLKTDATRYTIVEFFITPVDDEDAEDNGVDDDGGDDQDGGGSSGRRRRRRQS